MRKIVKVFPFLMLFLLAACTSINPTAATLPPATEYAPRTLYDLGGLEALRNRFNEDAGLTRLVLLVSPT